MLPLLFSSRLLLFLLFVAIPWHQSIVSSLTTTPCFVGFDLGTSGARISVLTSDDAKREIYSQALSWPNGEYDNPDIWMSVVSDLLHDAVRHLGDGRSIASICVSGTSASCLLIDAKNAGAVTRRPRMYNYDVLVSSNSDGGGTTNIHGVRALELLDQYAPDRHTTRSPTSSLAKLLAWHDEKPLSESERLCHQSDYVAMKLMSDDKACGTGPKNHRIVTSDWQNCLKLGYDVQTLEWPEWMHECLMKGAGMSSINSLPQQVVSPGEPMGTVSQATAERFGISKATVVVGGTTDSNAAFFAAAYNPTGEWKPGIAVTSLGSTLAIKQLSHNRVEDATVGVYSHRFPSVLLNESEAGTAWLVGGASNVGCAILRKLEFSNEELEELSRGIDPNTESGLSYYPLTKAGERFPVADSNKEPVLEPVPSSRRDYLHGILQGISSVECEGFLALAERGASLPRIVYSAGGGGQNDIWSQMRQRRLRAAFRGHNEKTEGMVVVKKAENSEASFGAALLAAAGAK